MASSVNVTRGDNPIDNPTAQPQISNGTQTEIDQTTNQDCFMNPNPFLDSYLNTFSKNKEVKDRSANVTWHYNSARTRYVVPHFNASHIESCVALDFLLLGAALCHMMFK